MSAGDPTIGGIMICMIAAGSLALWLAWMVIADLWDRAARAIASKINRAIAETLS